MATAMIGDILIARSNAKMLRLNIKPSSRWKIKDIDAERMIMLLVRGEKALKLTYTEVALHFDLLAQINKVQVIK